MMRVQAGEKASEVKEGMGSYVESAEEKIKETARGAIDTVKVTYQLVRHALLIRHDALLKL